MDCKLWLVHGIRVLAQLLNVPNAAAYSSTQQVNIYFLQYGMQIRNYLFRLLTSSISLLYPTKKYLCHISNRHIQPNSTKIVGSLCAILHKIPTKQSSPTPHQFTDSKRSLKQIYFAIWLQASDESKVDPGCRWKRANGECECLDEQLNNSQCYTKYRYILSEQLDYRIINLMMDMRIAQDLDHAESRTHTVSTNQQSTTEHDSCQKLTSFAALRTTNCSDLDASKMYEQVMGWFALKNIKLGNPNTINLEPTELKKREICTLNHKMEVDGNGLLGRRLKKRISVDI